MSTIPGVPLQRAPVPKPTALPSAWRQGWLRATLELRQFPRERDAVAFTFALPIVLLLLLSSIYHGTAGHTGVSIRQVLVPGMVAVGVASTSFLSLGVGIATEREDGTLKRIAGTPMPKVAYFAGKVVMVAVLGALETAILLAIGVGFLGLSLPHGGARWATFVWVMGLGLVSCALLGIAVSSLPRSARSAAAVINLPFVALQFISGTYVPFELVPHPLQMVASVFPLRWMALGLRSAFLPERFRQLEVGHAWAHGTTALVLAAWCIVGLVVCARTFRWTRRVDG